MFPAVQEPLPRDAQDAASLSSLIRGLHSLVDGPAYIGQLIAYGPKAIPALADLLLCGTPVTVSQPRQWAAEALGGLRAYEVLLAYLRQPINIGSPVVQHAEEAVRNAAARELGGFQTEETFTVLLDCLRRRPLPGVIETIGQYRRAQVAPYLIDCLEDDVCRTAGIQALEGLADSIRGLLVESALVRMPPLPEFESPSSIRRRRCCTRLLEHLDLAEDEVKRLTPLLREKDPDLVIAVAQVLLHTPHFSHFQSILFHLTRVQHTVGWWLQDEFRSLTFQIEEKLSQTEGEASCHANPHSL
ncbi:MAG TPA: HEAT repeat domain-containing protein [Bryobacteraceae bacterium]